MIIDAHVYCLPPELTAANESLKNEEPAVWESIFSHAEGPMALRLSHFENIQKQMRTASIDRSVLVSFPWQTQGRCRLNNDHLLAHKKSSQNFYAICSVNPFAPGWREEVERCKSLGAVGVKINPEWQGGSLSSEEVVRLASACAENGLFIMTHVDHPFKRSNASPAEFCDLLSKAPATHFIAAHMGGMIGLYSMNKKIGALLKNVWFDTAVSSTLEMVKHYKMAGLIDRTLFGSDFPFNHSHEQLQVKADLESVLPDATDREKVFGMNFLNLLARLN